MFNQVKKNSFFLLAVVIAIPAIIGLIHFGFPLTDDGNWMVIRFSAFYEALRSGQFPVRFLTRLNYGYGYPVADFLYPLFMYIGVSIHILGFSFVNTIKIILGLSLVFSSIFTFLWLRKIFDNVASLIGAIFYTFFPYHLFDVYIRGSIGEVLSLSIVPFILWQVERKSLFFTSIGIGLLIIAHNTLALLFLPLIFFYILLKQKKSLKFNLLSFIFGFLISSFFWIPALYDSQYTVFSAIQVSDFSKYFIDFKNINILGLIFFVVLFSSAILIILKDDIRKNKLFFYSFIFSFIILFFILPFSKIIWNIIPFANLIQFPFRLISLLIILLTFQIAFIINFFKRNKKILIPVLFLILICISAKPFLLPISYQYLPDTFYSTNQDSTTVKNEYMPKWVKNIPVSMYESKVEVLNGKEIPKILIQNANKTSFNVFLEKSRTIQVNTVYFPGWVIYVNGIKKDIVYDNPGGLIRVNLNKGQNNVEVIFAETQIRLFSDLLSIIGLVGIFICSYLIKRRRFNI